MSNIDRDKLEKRISSLHKSTTMLFPSMLCMHEYFRSKSVRYYNWHTNPISNRVHWLSLVVYLVIIMSLVFYAVYPSSRIQATTNTKTWTTTEDFAGGTLTDTQASSNQLELATTTELYTEDFSTTDYRDSGITTASWNIIDQRIELPSGEVEDLSSLWIDEMGTNDIHSMEVVGDFIFIGGYNGKFGYYNTTDGSLINLTDVISPVWYQADIISMEYDYDSRLYIGGKQSNRFGYYDLDSGGYVSLSDKTSSIFYCYYDMEFSVEKNRLYIVGYNPGFGYYDPVLDSAVNLGANLNNHFKYYIDACELSGDGSKLYLAGNRNHTLYGDYAYGGLVSYDLESNVSTILGSYSRPFKPDEMSLNSDDSKLYLISDMENLMEYDFSSGSYSEIVVDFDVESINYYAVDSIMYIGGETGEFGYYDFDSSSFQDRSSYLADFWESNVVSKSTIGSDSKVYIAGESGKMARYLEESPTNNDAVSIKVNSSENILQSAIMSVSDVNVPEGTSVSYYLSSDGGSNWESVETGLEHIFVNVGSDLRWKVNLQTTDSELSPTIGGITVSYTQVISSGTWSDVYDTSETGSAWYEASWNSTLPTGTSMTLKFRGSATEGGLSTATWSDTVDASLGSADLTSINVGGEIGLSDSQWVQVQADLATINQNTSILSDISIDYVVNSAPQIEDGSLSVAQRTDGSKIVDVSFSARDVDTATNPYNPDQVAVVYEYSIDGGENWNDCDTTTNEGTLTEDLQDVEANYTTFNGTWDVGTDLAGLYYDDSILLRVTIDDNELAHNEDFETSASFTVDAANPVAQNIAAQYDGAATDSGIQIDSMGVDKYDAEWTNDADGSDLGLTFSVTDDTNLQMIVSNSSDFSDSVYEAYSTSKTNWDLDDENGVKTVYVRFKDEFGNTTEANDSILLDTTAPNNPDGVRVFDVSNRSTENYGLAVLWESIETPEDALGHNDGEDNLYIIYRKDSEPGEYSELTQIDQNGYINSGLDSDADYYYKVASQDIHGNISIPTTEDNYQPASADIGDPVIDEDSVVVIPDENSCTVDWEVSDAESSGADGYIQYGLATNQYTNIQGTATIQTSHSVTLVGLDANTKYYFKVRATDASGNFSQTTQEYTCTTTQGESLSLSINPQSQIPGAGSESVDIYWQTNKQSRAEVWYSTESDVSDYSIAKPMGDLADEMSFSHNVKIINLTESTEYYYKTVNYDLYGNTVVSDIKTFETQEGADIIENSIVEVDATPETVATDIITNDVAINWTTQVPASSYVLFGLTDAYGSQEGSDSLTQEHSVTLKNLAANTTYHYRVKSVDQDNNTYLSEDRTFTTSSVVEPSISEISVVNIGLDTATINWKTNRSATSKIEYGFTSDALVNETEETDLAGNTTHTVTLEGLENGTNYYFRVRSTDVTAEDGGLLASAPYSFSTIALPVANSKTVSVENSNNAVVSVNTNVETRCFVEYSLNSNFSDSLLKQTTEFATSHKVELNKLQAQKTYYYRVKTNDKYGNQSVSESASFTTPKDTKAPVISNVKNEISTVGTGETARIQMIVSWTTDEPATSFVDFGEGIGKGDVEYPNTEPKTEDANQSRNQNHVVIVQNLKDSTTYHFRVRNADDAGNEVVSEDYTVLTPAKQQSILQVILGTLEKQFGWLVDVKNLFN